MKHVSDGKQNRMKHVSDGKQNNTKTTKERDKVDILNTDGRSDTSIRSGTAVFKNYQGNYQLRPKIYWGSKLFIH
jgi:hypothetical protein